MVRSLFSLVLTDNDRLNLLRLAGPRYEEMFAHHITLSYGVELSADQERLVGAARTITVTGVVWNDRIQAATVELDGLECQNVQPHITISAQPGVKPVESNAMLANPHHHPGMSVNRHHMDFGPPVRRSPVLVDMRLDHLVIIRDYPGVHQEIKNTRCCVVEILAESSF